ncbi:hypothetical protein NM688_g7502 [Phlebia brevispora]|uniref:Uncharacterized protein n=1 Tax=Phlebia brevispora TaxID=194682 RepID=A0ACC1S4G7_9APHY|nr:hypothetical protein NM688_g7502 [Phlebia brevispora]
MGGLKAIRWRGTYYLWYRWDDGYPAEPGLGMEVYNMIPKSPKMLKKWARNLRQEVGRMSKTYYKRFKTAEDPEEVDTNMMVDGGVFDIGENYEYGSSEYMYEIDLDNMIFSFNRYPFFHLDNMPPRDVFIQSCKKSSRHTGRATYAAYRDYTPAEFQFKLGRLKAPAVRNRELVTYKKYFSGALTEPQDILSLHKRLSRCENVCLRVLACYIDTYVDRKLFIMYQEIALHGDEISWNGREIACALAATALLPLHLKDVGSWTDTFGAADSEFWWMRKHICFTLATHLLDERRAQYHISRVTDEILANSDAPSVVYGVVFSLFHCIVLRVDRVAGVCCKHTEVLEFLPPPWRKFRDIRWRTPGMELLVRLGNLRASDDVQFFYSQLSCRWWDRGWKRIREVNATSDSEAGALSTSGTPPRVSQLPSEILFMIAFGIEEPGTLFDFALASKTTMAAAIPRLRFPQMRGRDYDSASHILDSCSSDWGVPPLFKFCIEYLGGPAVLHIMTEDDLKHAMGCEDAFRFRDVDGSNMPRGSFQFRCTSGDASGLWRFCGPPLYGWSTREERNRWHAQHPRKHLFEPHMGLAYITYWEPEFVKRLAKERPDIIEEVKREIPAILIEEEEPKLPPDQDTDSDDSDASGDDSNYEGDGTDDLDDKSNDTEDELDVPSSGEHET